MKFQITSNEATIDNVWDSSVVVHQTSSKPIKAGSLYLVRAIVSSDYLPTKTEQNFFFHTSSDAKRFISAKSLAVD